MPSRLHKLNRFDGGLNSKDDPRAIENNQVADIFNLVPDQKGSIVTVGGKSNESSHTGGDTTMGINNPGHGLFSFKSDASAGDSGETLWNLLLEPYAGDNTKARLQRWKRNQNKWNTKKIPSKLKTKLDTYNRAKEIINQINKR